MLLTTSSTGTSAKALKSGSAVDGLKENLKEKFLNIYKSAYGNTKSHNRLLANVAQWMVGNVMERLALMGISHEELEDIKSNVRHELVDKNHTAMEQVVYDETMMEVLT